MIFLRYMRLTPTLIIVILLNKFLALNFATNVPESFFDYSVKNCDKHWLSTIFHIQNYYNPKEMVILLSSQLRFNLSFFYTFIIFIYE